jgi:hypothetical protein
LPGKYEQVKETAQREFGDQHSENPENEQMSRRLAPRSDAEEQERH